MCSLLIPIFLFVLAKWFFLFFMVLVYICVSASSVCNVVVSYVSTMVLFISLLLLTFISFLVLNDGLSFSLTSNYVWTLLGVVQDIQPCFYLLVIALALVLDNGLHAGCGI